MRSNIYYIKVYIIQISNAEIWNERKVTKRTKLQPQVDLLNLTK